MPNFFKKLVKEVSRPFEYAARTGSHETYETGRSQTGGQIVEIKTINLVDSTPQIIAQSSFDAHLRSKGVNQAGIAHFQCLKWIDVGSRQRLQFHHRPNQTTCQKIGVAVRRIDDTTLRVSIVWKQSSVRTSEAYTLIHKRTSHYGFGYRQSDDSTEKVRRGLTHGELAKVKEALENEANKHNPEIEALQNV